MKKYRETSSGTKAGVQQDWQKRFELHWTPLFENTGLDIVHWTSTPLFENYMWAEHGQQLQTRHEMPIV